MGGRLLVDTHTETTDMRVTTECTFQVGRPTLTRILWANSNIEPITVKWIFCKDTF